MLEQLHPGSSQRMADLAERMSQLRDTQDRRQELADLAGGDQAEAYAASLLDQSIA